jgi:hypothetical protein
MSPTPVAAPVRLDYTPRDRHAARLRFRLKRLPLQPRQPSIRRLEADGLGWTDIGRSGPLGPAAPRRASKSK